MHVIGGSIQALVDAQLMGPDLMFIHACDSSDAELRAVAAHGSFLSSSPNLELNMLGLGAPPIRRFLAAGVRPSLSIDVETSVSGDMFSVMRAALMSQTAEELYQPGANDLPTFSPRDVIAFATIEGAKACGLADKIGSITEGKRGDLILIDLRDVNLAPADDEYFPDVSLAAAHPGNVDTVLIDGVAVRRNNRPVNEALITTARSLAAESRARLRATAEKLAA